MTQIHFDKQRIDTLGVSQIRISTRSDHYGVTAIASTHLDLPSKQWVASIRFSPPPSPQEGWPAETFDVLQTLVTEAITEARKLLAERSTPAPIP
jgi:hypothetical protein